MKTLIVNAKIWDGSGAVAYVGELLILIGFCGSCTLLVHPRLTVLF